MFNILRCFACCRPSRTWVAFNRLSAIFEALIASFPKAFWIIGIASVEECSSFMQNLVQICCSTCSVVECDSLTGHVLTQWRLLPLLTSTVKSSLSAHAHFSPLSLTARLHLCHAICSCYIKNGWTFFWTDSIYTVFLHLLVCYFTTWVNLNTPEWVALTNSCFSNNTSGPF